MTKRRTKGQTIYLQNITHKTKDQISYLKMGDCKTRNKTKQDKAETKRDATQQK